MFENNRKSIIQHCERSELRLHFEWTKTPKMVNFGEFLKTRSLLSNSVTRRLGQKLMENAKIQKFKSDILSDF